MKVKICSVILTIFSITLFFGVVQAQSRLDLKNKPINNALLVEILNNSQMKELKPTRPRQSNFFLRLYSIGELGTCEPETETEVVCSFKYYLAVSSGDLGVSGVVYDLGEVGEITDVQWLENSNNKIDKLRLEISNYPAQSFEHNSKLIRKTRIVELDVSLNSLILRSFK